MTPAARSISRARGFTLIEVMISMVLVLGLIIGINAVFKMAADTVGTGQQLSAKMRDSRAAQAVFQNDLSQHATIKGAPFLIIDSRTQLAFRDVRDRESDRDFGTPGVPDVQMRTIDMDGDNVEGSPTVTGEFFPRTSMNDRAHRVDTLSFFASSGELFRRQTGNPGVYVDQMSSYQAWITYGHTRVFDQSGDANLDNDNLYFPPGFGTALTNPKNFYASDWVLGRMVMLMLPPQQTVPIVPGSLYNTIYDKAGASQYFWYWPKPTSFPFPANTWTGLQPMGRGTNAAASSNPPPAPTPPTMTISDARFDVVGSSIPEFKDTLITYLQWFKASSPGYYEDWWDVLPCSPDTFPAMGATPYAPILGRFRCNPYPLKPIDSRKAAQAAAVMLSNCSQFVVEYAGDFLQQGPRYLDSPPNPVNTLNPNYGLVTNAFAFYPPAPVGVDPATDGKVDFIVDWDDANDNGLVDAAEMPTARERIRWYGFPRDVAQYRPAPAPPPNIILQPDGSIRGWTPNPTSLPKLKTSNQLPDVVPLRDLMRAGSVTPGVSAPLRAVMAATLGAPFERTRYVDATTGKVNEAFPARDDYANPYADTSPLYSPPLPNADKGLIPENHYTCAWSPYDTRDKVPTMLRIIIRLDDPNGRLSEGHVSEFIINLPQ